MDATTTTRPAATTTHGNAADSAQIAKATLRRLATAQLEPTPGNYARAWAQESGEPLPVVGSDGPAIAGLIERIVRGLERGSKGWTAARKKESLQRVLDGSRSDAKRLQQRLTQLVTSWAEDIAGEADEAIEVVDAAVPAPDDEPNGPTSVSASTRATASAPAPAPAPVSTSFPASTSDAPGAPAPAGLDLPQWTRAVDALGSTVAAGRPPSGDGEAPLGEIEALVRGIVDEGVTLERVEALERCCHEIVPQLAHRHRLVEQLNGLCVELAASLTDLAEDRSWAQGQCEAMRAKLDEGLSARGIRAVSELLRDTRERQTVLRIERERARESLKGLIARMLGELDELGSRTGQFHQSVGRYADVIERADSLESLTGVVREMVEESRSVQSLVAQTQARLSEEHGRTEGLSRRVVELEAEMQRLSSEVATDQLTQVANHRGLMLAFEAEQARHDPQAAPLAVALLDIDNFKRLNDELGHGAGDEALKALATRVARTLRPGDHVARYGGEEFVVLLPATALADAQHTLARLQRSLSSGLFMHQKKQVLVTFSAGVTTYRAGEAIEDALDRADRALYDAKRAGKNRTCIA